MGAATIRLLLQGLLLTYDLLPRHPNLSTNICKERFTCPPALYWDVFSLFRRLWPLSVKRVPKWRFPLRPCPQFFSLCFDWLEKGDLYLLFWGNARCASQGRVKGLWWSLDCDAHRVTSNRTQPTAWRGSLWGWSLPVGHAWGLKTCSHAIVQCPGRTSMIMCSICKMFILWRDLKQTELIFTESCSQKNWPFFSQALLFPHSSSILLSKMLTRKLRMEPWGHSVFCRNYIQQ